MKALTNMKILHMLSFMKAKTNAKDFYTILEFAEYIGVCYRTILNGIKKGHIEAFKVGRGKKSHYRIPHTEVQRMGVFHLDEIIDAIVEQKLKERDERNKQAASSEEKG